MRLRTPAFWYNFPTHGPAWPETALAPLSLLYDRMRRSRQGKIVPCKAPMPVLCAGNLTAGGSGKTPAALALMDLLQKHALFRAPHFLTRGYGGRLRGPVCVDPRAHTARDTGDEALLLAARAPVILAADRPAGAKLAADLDADLIIMDDGLQNPSLRKDIAFVVVDGAAGFGNEKLLPAGPLREPLSEGFARADAFILLGKDERHTAGRLPAGKPVFTGRLAVPEDGVPDPIHRYIAFAGLGRPEKFRRTLENLKVEIAGWHPFPDHYPYKKADLERLTAESRARNARLITTEKDLIRIKALDPAAKITALPVQIVWDDEEALLTFLRRKLGGGPA